MNRKPLVGGDGERGDNRHRHAGRTLESVAPVLGLYYRALAGRNAAILPDASDGDPERYPDTHTTIRLPAQVARFRLGSANFDWYKVALTHRAAHYSGGTFRFAFDADAAFFARLRPNSRSLERSEHSSDLELFFGLFTLRELAIETFTVLEALRIDEWAKRRYPGLTRKYEAVQRDARHERGGYIAKRSPRDALAEVLIQASLGRQSVDPLPALLHEPVLQVLAICRTLARDGARVEDTAEATVRAYSLIARLPNLPADYGPAAAVDLAQVAAKWDWPTDWPEPERNRLEGEEVMHTLFEPVGYRDPLGSRISVYKSAGPLDQQAIYRFTDAPTRTGQAAPADQSAADADTRPEGPPEPLEHDHHDHFPGDDAAHAAGELHSHERGSYVYPEWDHVTQSYRRAWCLVRETHLDPGASVRFFDETLRAYGSLVPGVRRELERIAYEGLRRVHRLPHGEEIDLDAAIENRVDVRAGLAPDDKLYMARQIQARDVTLALLVDVSSSTAEHTGDLPPGPMAAALAKVHGRPYRTILDLEKEALVLLMAALERIGDTYGIYCFSGSGRQDVKFRVLKDLDERLSDTAAARFESLRPLHTTRMGPALRHAVRKLRAHESKTKLLLLLSDGRPFDLDYGQQYGDGAEVAYAQNDTRQALLEAQQHGIRPFVLTVDPHGNDYLREMCDGIGYEVLNDVAELPLRLVTLYRSLTR
jgi:nitric oxide reductase activation protein